MHSKWISCQKGRLEYLNSEQGEKYRGKNLFLALYHMFISEIVKKYRVFDRLFHLGERKERKRAECIRNASTTQSAQISTSQHKTTLINLSASLISIRFEHKTANTLHTQKNERTNQRTVLFAPRVVYI